MWTFLYTPRGSEVQISHKPANKYFKNIQKSITELLHLAAATTWRIIVPHVTYKILDLFGLSKFKGGGGNAPLAPLIKISLPTMHLYRDVLPFQCTTLTKPMLNLRECDVTIQCKHWVSLEPTTFAVVSMVPRRDYHMIYNPYIEVLPWLLYLPFPRVCRVDGRGPTPTSGTGGSHLDTGRNTPDSSGTQHLPVSHHIPVISNHTPVHHMSHPLKGTASINMCEIDPSHVKETSLVVLPARW